MTPGALPRAIVGTHRLDVLADLLPVLLLPDVDQRHLEELLAAVAVLLDRGFVDGDESQGLAVVDPHGNRVPYEQQPERSLALLELRDVDADPDAASVGGAALVDANPAAILQLLLVSRMFPAVALEPCRQPFLLAAFRLRMQAGLNRHAHGVDKVHARLDVNVVRVHFRVASVPQHETVVGIAKHDGFRHDLHGIEQARMRRPRLALGALGFRARGGDRLLGLLQFGDVRVGGDPPAARHGTAGDRDRAAVGELDHLVDGLALGNGGPQIGDVLIGVAHGEGAGPDAAIEQLAQRAAWRHDVGRQSVHLPIALRAQYQAAC